MKTVLIVMTLLLTACATTPQDTMQTEPYHMKSALPPAQAAHCLIRTAESKVGNFTGREEEPPAPGARKIVIRHPDAGTSVVAHVMPDGTGSAITLWLSWQHFLLRDTLVAAITRGC